MIEERKREVCRRPTYCLKCDEADKRRWRGIVGAPACEEASCECEALKASEDGLSRIVNFEISNERRID